MISGRRAGQLAQADAGGGFVQVAFVDELTGLAAEPAAGAGGEGRPVAADGLDLQTTVLEPEHAFDGGFFVGSSPAVGRYEKGNGLLGGGGEIVDLAFGEASAVGQGRDAVPHDPGIGRPGRHPQQDLVGGVGLAHRTKLVTDRRPDWTARTGADRLPALSSPARLGLGPPTADWSECFQRAGGYRGRVAVLVDEARWPWRGRLWAHLVSDSSYDELHELARSIGLRRIGFQGDHYDVDETDRARALAAGAVAANSRELVRRLRAAGLRRPGGRPRWQRLASSPAGAGPDQILDALVGLGDAGERLAAGIGRLGPLAAAGSLGLFSRPGWLAAVIDFSPPAPVADDRQVREVVDEVWLSGPRPDGQRSLELFVAG